MIRAFVRKVTAVFLCCCMLLTAFSGTAILAQAEELGTAVIPNTQVDTLSTSDYDVVVGFRNFYDSCTFGTAKSYIDSAITFTKRVFVENFSVFAERDGSVVVDTVSGLSGCTLEDTGPCRAASGCGTNSQHHKDIGLISNSYYNWYLSNCYANDTYEDRTIVVLWTNYTDVYCWNKLQTDGSYTHQYISANAVVLEYRPVIHIMNLGTSLASRFTAHMSILLAHELTHCFGFDDVYESTNHQADSTVSCLMDYFEVVYYSATEANKLYSAWYNNPDQAFCSSCKAAIKCLF